ncbi:MAG: PspA/IM30 family protein [Hyphomicrobiaceae bacterium]
MFKMLTTLVRGAAAEAEQAVFDANALRILEQQLRDAAGALEHSKKELACAMAHRASEARAVEALNQRIAELEHAAGDALTGGREDLAREAATVIAATEDERTERTASMKRFDVDIARLRQLSEDGRKRLVDLRRGLEIARAQEALRRAGANGRRALATGTGSLREAEATLAKIREGHMKSEDFAEACEALDAEASGKVLDDRLAAAGFGPSLKTKPDDVLARLRQRTATKPTQPETK